MGQVCEKKGGYAWIDHETNGLLEFLGNCVPIMFRMRIWFKTAMSTAAGVFVPPLSLASAPADAALLGPPPPHDDPPPIALADGSGRSDVSGRSDLSAPLLRGGDTTKAECDWAFCTSEPLLQHDSQTTCDAFDSYIDVETVRSWIRELRRQVLFWSVVASPTSLNDLLRRSCRVVQFAGRVTGAKLHCEQPDG